jgi:hypothetical protein
MSKISTNRFLKLKLIVIGSAAYFAMTLSVYAVSVSSDTNGMPGDTFSTPESKANPIPPESRSSEIIIPQGSATVMIPEIPPPPPRPVPATRWH